MATTDEARAANLGLENVAADAGLERYARPLAEWFTARTPGRVVGIEDLATPSEGLSNETVLFDVVTETAGELRSERYVARIQAEGQPLAPQQTPRCTSSIEFECHLQSAASSAGTCPVAPIVGFEADTSVLGRPFFVMRHIAGRVPGVQPSFHTEGFMRDEATPSDRRHLVETTLEAVARLHAIVWRDTELRELFDEGVEPDLAYQLRIYRDDFEMQLAGRPFPLVTSTFEWLERTDPGPHVVGLVWGDARLGNVICDDGYEAAALLDWENGFVGPTDADIGWWLVSERVNHDLLAIPRLEGYPDYGEHLALYEAAAGRAVANVRYWEVFAALRMAHGMLRLADRMAASGALPAEMSELGFENPVTTVLGSLLRDA
jgi:aminoglycoside phosphotransferase (APT) family kinase protein